MIGAYAADAPASDSGAVYTIGITNNDCNANGTLDSCDIASGTSQDCNGNGLPDECEGGPQPGGSAIQFDGIDDLVRIPNSASLALGTQATIEAWVRLDSVSGPGGIRLLGKGDGGDCTSERSFEIGVGLDGLGPRWTAAFFTGSSGPCHWINLAAPQAIPLGEWIHVAATVNTQTASARLFLNGIQVIATNTFAGGEPITPEPIRLSTQDLYFGALPPFSGTFMNGMVDEVRIWNVARAPSEILESYNRTVPDCAPGLVGYWKFDESQYDQFVTDSSGSGNHGTLGVASASQADDPVRVCSTIPLLPQVPSTDCNLNEIPDECDILSGAIDCDGNGVLDECELSTAVAAHAVQFDGVDDYVGVAGFGAIAPTAEITIEL